jgi:hypothetical protein
MLPNRQLSFIVTDFIEDIGRVAHRDRDEFRAVLRELIRRPTVKSEPHAIAQRRRKRSGMAILTGHWKALPIGGGQQAAAPAMT